VRACLRAYVRARDVHAGLTAADAQTRGAIDYERAKSDNRDRQLFGFFFDNSQLSQIRSYRKRVRYL